MVCRACGLIPPEIWLPLGHCLKRFAILHVGPLLIHLRFYRLDITALLWRILSSVSEPLMGDAVGTTLALKSVCNMIVGLFPICDTSGKKVFERELKVTFVSPVL